MATLADVAKEAGVSVMSASNVMRGKPSVSPGIRERVLAAAARLDYRVNAAAQSLRSGRSGVIALCVPRLDMPFNAAFAAAATSTAEERGLRVMVQQTLSDPRREIEILRGATASLVDGTIVSAVGATAQEVEQAAGSHAVVLYDERIRDTPLDLISSPNESGGRAAVEHLIAKGCRHVVVLGTHGPRRDLPGPDGPDLRWTGALQAAQGSPQVRLTPVPCLWDCEPAYAAMLSTLAVGTPVDGVFALTDSMALGALRALSDLGLRCPEDVRVIGFDGIREGAMSTPSLSTIDIDITQLARTSVEMLLTRIDSPVTELPGRRFTSAYTLIERESSR
ncbi:MULTISPECIES: LacI family DNA-binding transcriptional regulator [unclassified Actinomyces]|uniref:LacI family DNA-binding transcriptional regulator n=1 Tax=unclassified Actinomyces TaxID=2609248 RepID=UPI002017F0C1|nr:MULTISPECIES: LacI family DNA-binding transcriptional regulator [unclassified Actinomyces]MCL3777143.1 LacI family DNA-binding transcriptional regulator [Actinomyces sp. AC-20-1]MCL3788941.1 LacI family DNA-binding transcriptional regulator [Actinomyces sp. 187325]MCL3791329.1 LacI family DNA-binding transcriptional regulator [Actinomyces sp. 186855]MCL3794160.1 LacI family DNA-binding transcriptional regulator [Actinomyces sp. 217892]